MKIIVLDSLFDSLALETEVAEARAATIERWDGEIRSLADADAVAHVRTRVDADLIAALPNCRVIARFGTGLDTVDLAAAKRAGMSVVAVRDYCIPELASHTLSLAFALVRRLTQTTTDLEANWQHVSAKTPIHRYEDVTVIGLGSIGRRIATALEALSYRVRVVTNHAAAEARRNSWPRVTLEEGLRDGRLIFLHTALDASTQYLIDRDRLRLMAPNAILIDTARIGLLDQAAVADALENNRLGGLGLDADLPPESPLRRFASDPRVLVTPHIGWYSEDSAAALRTSAISQTLDILERNRQEVATP